MSRYRKSLTEAYRQVREQESDHEISMARGELEAISNKATELSSALEGMSDQGNPLEAWVQSKITKAKDYINSVSDYLMYNPDIKMNESFSQTLKQKAVAIAKKMSGNYTGAVKEIEKLAKGLSDDPVVSTTLRRVNEDLKEADNYPTKGMNDKKHAAYNDPKKGEKKIVDPKPKIQQQAEETLDEAKLKDIFMANQEGKKTDEIAKKLGMSVADVKKILGEDLNKKDEPSIKDVVKQLKGAVKAHAKQAKDLEKALKTEEDVVEFTTSQLNTLKKSYADMKGKTISPEKATALSKHLDKLDLLSLRQLNKEKIPFISTLARNKIYRKTGKFEELEEKKLTVKKGDKVRVINDFEFRTYSQMGYKLVGKDGQPMKEDRYAGARSIVETITAVKNKAKKTGMPYSILKKVYDRGMAAWKGGHRPGATQQQWALARVNSFVTKSSGTWGGADKDLAAKVRGSKK